MCIKDVDTFHWARGALRATNDAMEADTLGLAPLAVAFRTHTTVLVRLVLLHDLG